MKYIADILGASIGFALFIGLLLAVILAFEIWMFVDAILNKQISDEARILWLIGMILIHPFVAIIYYFTDHKKRIV